MIKLITAVMAVLMLTVPHVNAASYVKHTVVSGDSMWKIAVRYEVGLREIKDSNSHIKNPDLIYPGQIINVPRTDDSVVAFENEVIRLVNETRVKNGLKALEADWELSRVARIKSQDMKDLGYFSHTSPTYGSPFQMMKNFIILFHSEMVKLKMQ